MKICLVIIVMSLLACILLYPTFIIAGMESRREEREAEMMGINKAKEDNSKEDSETKDDKHEENIG